MKRSLTKEQIVSSQDVQTEFVATPEWAPKGTTPADSKTFGVYVRGCSAKEADDYENGLTKTKVVGDKTEVVLTAENAKARLVALCLVNENGVPLDITPAELGLKSAAPINRLFRKAQELSGLSRGAAKTIEGNSDAG